MGDNMRKTGATKPEKKERTAPMVRSDAPGGAGVKIDAGYVQKAETEYETGDPKSNMYGASICALNQGREPRSKFKISSCCTGIINPAGSSSALLSLSPFVLGIYQIYPTNCQMCRRWKIVAPKADSLTTAGSVLRGPDD